MTDPTAEGRGMADVALVGTGLLLGLALTAGWVARTAWGITRDRCGQVHRGIR